MTKNIKDIHPSYFKAKLGMIVSGNVSGGVCKAYGPIACVYEADNKELISERWEDITIEEQKK